MTKRPTLRIVARDGVASAAELQADYEAALARRRELDGAASSTVDAFWFLVRLSDPDRSQSQPLPIEGGIALAPSPMLVAESAGMF